MAIYRQLCRVRKLVRTCLDGRSLKVLGTGFGFGSTEFRDSRALALGSGGLNLQTATAEPTATSQFGAPRQVKCRNGSNSEFVSQTLTRVKAGCCSVFQGIELELDHPFVF